MRLQTPDSRNEAAAPSTSTRRPRRLSDTGCKLSDSADTPNVFTYERTKYLRTGRRNWRCDKLYSVQHAPVKRLVQSKINNRHLDQNTNDIIIRPQDQASAPGPPEQKQQKTCNSVKSEGLTAGFKGAMEISREVKYQSSR